MVNKTREGYWHLAVLVAMLFLARYAWTQPEHPLTFLSKQCNENAIEILLNPGSLQDFVGSKYRLVLEEGKASLLIVVQDCSQYWINGEDLGQTQEIHVWALIQGLGDVRTVVGAEQSPPTRTWFNLFIGCNNTRVREAKVALGIVEHSIESLSFEPPGAQSGGRASVAENLSFSWQVPVSAMPQVRLLGLNHDVYVKDSTGNVVLKRIQALAHTSAGNSQGTLNVVGESNLLPWIRPGAYPVSVRAFFPIWVRTTLGLSPSS